VQSTLKAALRPEVFRHLAFSSDLPGLFGICDLYLNPPRLGGGSSAAFALASGVPVFSLAFGDVANILPDPFVMSSPADMLAAIRTLLLTADRAAVRDLARASFVTISDRTGMVSDLLRRIGVDIPLPLFASEPIQTDS